MPPTPHDHDRITMPSRRADGTLDQTDPELIGPVTDALAGITHQVQSQAVAAQDDQDTTAVEAAQVQAREDAEAEVTQLHPDAHDQGAAPAARDDNADRQNDNLTEAGPVSTPPTPTPTPTVTPPQTRSPFSTDPVGPFGTEPTPVASPAQDDASPVGQDDTETGSTQASNERTPGPDA